MSSLNVLTAQVNALGGGMAFQAMNHGLEARATSPPRIEAAHNLEAESVLVLCFFKRQRLGG